MMAPQSPFDVIVVGAGPAGLAAGISCAELGLRVAVAGPRADPNDGRTAALFDGSIALLKRLHVWPAIADVSAPLTAIRLIDATGRLLRAPELIFRAHEIGLDAFGYNVPNAALTAALEARAAGVLRRVEPASVTGFAIGTERVDLETADGETLSSKLVAAADGRNSTCRTAAQIETKAWSYDQAALVCTLAHTRDHGNVSTEFHRAAGPLTLVPGPGLTSSLVWVDTRTEADRLLALDEDAFLAELGRHLSGLLGRISLSTPRRVFPLSGQTAHVLAKNRVALIGEAGHVIPPIGAQGLNLSFRDAATLAELASAARDRGEDIGGAAALQQFDAARRSDVTARVWTIDALNRSLLSDYLPVHLARGLGLVALGTFGPLRRLLMREGVGPSRQTPRLMQPAG